ncbi:uncharacterized protein LOC100680409 isoform X2 [Nasonia vitripennis]|uniref:Proline-rich transmembrane protein 3/4 domain-containing protein n=1 Tax=Nasonia vitripennis TaxID=7425 RepID=A0A7M7M7H8_NASVI|nr:uncharacterized protein LOC100680409 isoform X2 [Nasonia vitripennis]
MDRLPNLTRDDSIPIPGQNCVLGSSGFLLDGTLVTSPSWESVNQELRWFFLLHTYAFACLFFVLSFYTFFSLLNLRSLISTPPLMSTININLCLLGASRSGCLFIDPYNLKEIMPKVIGSITWDIGFPFITSAFCLIQLAFLQLTQVKFGLEKFQKETYLSLMIIFHFSCIIISDVSLAFHVSYIATYVVQDVFLLWGIVLYVTFLYAGYKVKALLRTLPSNLLTRDNSGANQKGIMQLAMLAPYNNLATSVAAALVPTLLGPKLKAFDDSEPNKGPDTNPSLNSISYIVAQRGGSVKSSYRVQQENEKNNRQDESFAQPISTVPEVYVRPPTPTPSIANLPIITVSSPSRRSSLASRRGSDVSGRNSRRASECSVRFVNEEDASPNAEFSSVQIGKRSPEPESSPRQSPSLDRPRTPEGILRRNSDCISTTPTGSNKDLRRSSDFGHEKNRSQFATKLRRNSDFGNRTPRRAQQEQEQSKLARILDVSPTGSRRNSDLGGLAAAKVVESRRNSDVSCRSSDRRGSDVSQIKPLVINRRSSDISIQNLDKSPTHYSPNYLPDEKTESQQQQELKSESDSDQPDNYYGNEKAALMNGDNKPKDEDQGKSRKKNLSWKCDKVKNDQEDITAETSLLPEVQQQGRVTGADFTLHSILNHIAYVNRAKSDTPLHIPEASTAAARRAQIKRVLNVTYATAILGIILCIAEAGRIFGPYGLLANVVKHNTKPTADQYPRPWPWIIYQTVCRLLELIMACAMASITKQPSASPRHQYLSNYPNYNLRMKQRENLYI